MEWGAKHFSIGTVLVEKYWAWWDSDRSQVAKEIQIGQKSRNVSFHCAA